MTELAVVLNPVADRGRAGAREGELRGLFREFGVEPRFLRTEGPGQATELVRNLCQEGLPRVVVAGGDGTLNEAAQALIGTETALGIIPLGSGNDFLRSLVGGLDLREAVRRAITGEIRKVDMGEANGRFYLNSLGMGLDGQIAQDYVRMKFLRGELGYLWAAIYEIARFRPFHLRLRADGQELQRNGLMVAVMNGPYAAGGFHLAPRADPADGALDLVAISNYSRPVRLPVLLAVRMGKHLGFGRVRHLLVREVEIRADRALPVHLDGELLTPTPELYIRIHPQALQVAL